MNGAVSIKGDVGFHIVRRESPTEFGDLKFKDVVKYGLPRFGLSKKVNVYRVKNLVNLVRGLYRIIFARTLNLSHFYGAIYAKVIRANGQIEDYGLVSARVVTTAGVTEVCTRFAGTSAANIANFKYHGVGTGTTAEASGDTALVTELTTEYSSDNVRPTGSQSASTNTYTTVGTATVDATVAITEHGIFTQAATGGGTLLDRSKFTALNLVSGDSLQATYVLTLSAGG